MQFYAISNLQKPPQAKAPPFNPEFAKLLLGLDTGARYAAIKQTARLRDLDSNFNLINSTLNAAAASGKADYPALAMQLNCLFQKTSRPS